MKEATWRRWCGSWEGSYWHRGAGDERVRERAQNIPICTVGTDYEDERASGSSPSR